MLINNRVIKTKIYLKIYNELKD